MISNYLNRPLFWNSSKRLTPSTNLTFYMSVFVISAYISSFSLFQQIIRQFLSEKTKICWNWEDPHFVMQQYFGLRYSLFMQTRIRFLNLMKMGSDWSKLSKTYSPAISKQITWSSQFSYWCFTLLVFTIRQHGMTIK